MAIAKSASVKAIAAAPPEFPPRTEFETGTGADVPNNPISKLLLSSDGKRAAVYRPRIGSDKSSTDKIQIWDIAGEPKKIKEYAGRLVAMSPDGSRIIFRAPLIGFLEPTRIMNIETDEIIVADVPLRDHARYQSNEVIWDLPSPWHSNIRAEKIEITKYDGNSGKKIGTYLIDREGKGFFHNGPMKDDLDFYFVTNSAKVLVWDSTTQEMKRQISLAFEANEQPSSVCESFAISSGGKWMVSKITTAQNNGRTARYDLSADAVAEEIDIVLGGNRFQFISNRDVFLTRRPVANETFEIVAYDIATKKMVGKFVGVKNSYLREVLSTNGSVMAVATDRGKVQIWDLDQLK